MVIGLEILQKFVPEAAEADQLDSSTMLERVTKNLERLEEAVKEGAQIDTVNVLVNIHNQLIDCPEVVYLLTPDDVATLIDQYIGKGREQIVTEKTATATLKKEEKDRKKRLAAHDKVIVENVSVDDY